MLARFTSIVAAFAAVGLMSAVAFADPGGGLHAGRLTLSPGVTAAGVLDTNLFRTSVSEAGGPVIAPSVALTPFLTINTDPGAPVSLGFDGRATWQQHIDPGNPIVTAQSGLSADVGADIGVNEEGAFSLRLGDRFQRTNEPPSAPSDVTYNRTLNRLGVTAGVHPGGKVFQHYLSYDWLLFLHDELADTNRMIHDLTLKNYWRFLPRTAGVLNADFQIVQYETDARLGGAYANVNSTPLRVTGGLSGLITKRLSVRLLGGYGWSFHQGDTSFNGLLVDTLLTFVFGNLAENNRLFAGYELNFQDSLIAIYARYHRPYVGYEQGIAKQRLRFTSRVEALIRSYVGSPIGSFSGPSGDVVINDALEDFIIRGQAGLTFKVFNWWALSLQYHLITNLTNDVIAVGGGAEDVVREYMRHLVTFGTTFKY